MRLPSLPLPSSFACSTFPRSGDFRAQWRGFAEEAWTRKGAARRDDPPVQWKFLPGAGRRPGRTALLRADPVWPHHLVVLVLDDVAVPDVLARCVELCPEASDFAWIRYGCILQAVLPGLGRPRVPGFRDSGNLAGFLILCEGDRLPVDHLEGYLVDMHGVRIGREVVEFPILGVAHVRVLADRIGPHLVFRYVIDHVAQHGFRWPVVTGNI